MNDSPQILPPARRDLRQPGAPSSPDQRFPATMGAVRKPQARGLMLTSLLCLLVWSGYNTAIFVVMDPHFPKNFINFVHGVRAFFPMLAGLIAAAQVAQRRSLPKWLSSSPLILLLLYAAFGLASSIFVSPQPIPAVYWALQYISVLVVVLAVASSSDPEKNLARFISVNWACCAAVCLGLLAGIPVLGGLSPSPRAAGSPLHVMAYGKVRDEVMGMTGPRSTGLGRFAGILLLVGLAKLLHDRRDKRTLFIWTPLILAGGVALLLSQARTSWISVVVAIAVLLARAPTRWRVPIIMLVLLALPLVWLSGFGHTSMLYLTRGREFDTTLSGRTVTWAKGWQALQQSPWAGLGFWADRYFLNGWNVHNTLLDALMQSGFLGVIPFVIAIVWVWAGILRFYSTKPARETSSLPGELLAVMTFLTVYSVTEITCSFYSVGWMVMAPLFAHVQLRAYQNARKRRAVVVSPAPLRGSTVMTERPIGPIPGRDLASR